MICTNVPVSSYRSIPSRDVLQRPHGSLLGVVSDTAGDQRQVHADSDGAPQPLYTAGVCLLLQQRALSLQVLKGNKESRMSCSSLRAGFTGFTVTAR